MVGPIHCVIQSGIYAAIRSAIPSVIRGDDAWLGAGLGRAYNVPPRRSRMMRTSWVRVRTPVLANSPCSSDLMAASVLPN